MQKIYFFETIAFSDETKNESKPCAFTNKDRCTCSTLQKILIQLYLRTGTIFTLVVLQEVKKNNLSSIQVSFFGLFIAFYTQSFERKYFPSNKLKWTTVP